MAATDWCCVVSAQQHVHVYAHKHDGRVCTCMGQNGFITCARKVITCTRNSYYVHT